MITQKCHDQLHENKYNLNIEKKTSNEKIELDSALTNLYYNDRDHYFKKVIKHIEPNSEEIENSNISSNSIIKFYKSSKDKRKLLNRLSPAFKSVSRDEYFLLHAHNQSNPSVGTYYPKYHFVLKFT